jgi:cyanophycin synthetase
MKHKDLRFLKILSLRGPSLWTYRPVLEVWVDIGELEECPSNTIPGFVERLCAWLPTLAQHRCSIGEPGGFVKRLQMGTWPAHILEHVTLELQNLAGTPGGFGRARETPERGVYKVAVSAEHEDVTRACLEAGRELVMAAIEDTPFDVAATIEGLRELVHQHLLGPNTACIVDAARAKDRGIPAIRLSADNLVQLGYGSRQRRIWAAETDRTCAIAVDITRSPELSRRLLKSCGLPVADPDDPQAEFCGQPHRLLVVGGKLVAAARMDADGDPNTPGPATADVTERVHPATAAAACLAARVVGLDIAGVDLVANDLAIPLAAQHGALTAVHAGPGLTPHLRSADGTPRPVGRAIVDHLFPNGDSGRIPVVGITGSVGTTDVARLVAEFLRLSGKVTGLACGSGLFLNRRQVATGDCGNWQSATRVLMNRSVEAAVLENNAEVILGQGLAYDRCQVAVVTRIEPEQHFGPYYVASPEYVFKVFRTQVDVVLPDGVAVLDAADPLVAGMERLCDGEVIFFALDPSLPVIMDHQARGGRTVCVHGDELVLTTTDGATTLIGLSAIPFLNGERSNDSVACVLAAVGTAWALGIAIHVIRTGVETFANDPEGGRLPDPPEPPAASRS